MQGNCTSALPVGLSAYIAAEFNLLSPLQHMQPSPEQNNHNTNLDHNQNGQLTHQWPTASAQHSSSNSGSAQHAVEPSPGTSTLPHGSSSRRRQVGVHANAAWQPAAELPGCGPLLPSWRQLTDLLVPLLHNVRVHRGTHLGCTPFCCSCMLLPQYAVLFTFAEVTCYELYGNTSGVCSRALSHVRLRWRVPFE